ncbi:peroxisomal succinyl-coenzyme A thioesterase-like isoform X1 [Conger conger]|uniref:peroxisomal succinyl-coenzyme A thioesterase-like isoform X1 n=1 Tax=Conger conger TaxID=82655 RepID=UPI002A5AEFDB|nr:peroxisomal succinyl-coenzyme A thioesterase-like isoform X1 [Conger conger]
MSGFVPGPLLTVKPSRGLVDEKFEVVVRNLSPGEEVTLYSLHQSEDKDYWEAFGHYVSDAGGTITVAADASVGGSYLGIESMGLLWSMKPVPGSRKGLRLRKMDACSPMLVHISVHRGHISQGFAEAVPLATALAERWYLAPGVRRVEVQEKGVKGTLFLPPGPGPFPGILDMWGGGGGLLEYRSALLASHGFVSMALDYLPWDKKPSKARDIILSYFESAFNIVREHPLVATDRVALFGLSLGASVSIALATTSRVNPTCCVCINGGHVFSPVKHLESLVKGHAQGSNGCADLIVATPGLEPPTLRVPVIYLNHYATGRPKRQINQKVFFDENNHQIWRNINLPIPDDPGQKMQLGNIKCPVMLIVGLDDQNWPSKECAEDMEMIMEKAGNVDLLTVLSYPEAGHLIEPPYTPHFRSSNFILQYNREKVVLCWGGRPKLHADAQEDSWRKILQFLRLHLCQKHAPALASKL